MVGLSPLEMTEVCRVHFRTAMIGFCIFLAGNFRLVPAEPVFVLVRRPFAENRTSQSVEGRATILNSEFWILTACLNLFGSGSAGLGFPKASHQEWQTFR